MRIGAVRTTLLIALSHAFEMRRLEATGDRLPGKEELKEKLKVAEQKLKTVYAQGLLFLLNLFAKGQISNIIYSISPQLRHHRSIFTRSIRRNRRYRESMSVSSRHPHSTHVRQTNARLIRNHHQTR